jgi:hypothetical protein
MRTKTVRCSRAVAPRCPRLPRAQLPISSTFGTTSPPSGTASMTRRSDSPTSGVARHPSRFNPSSLAGDKSEISVPPRLTKTSINPETYPKVPRARSPFSCYCAFPLLPFVIPFLSGVFWLAPVSLGETVQVLLMFYKLVDIAHPVDPLVPRDLFIYCWRPRHQALVSSLVG